MDKTHFPSFLEPQQYVSNLQPLRYTHQRLKQLDVDEAERTRIDKEGLVVLRVNLSCLFSKDGFGRATMQSPMDYLKVFEIYVSTSAPLPKHLTKDLKPMTLTVEKASRLPTTPLTHKELRERYVRM